MRALGKKTVLVLALVGAAMSAAGARAEPVAAAVEAKNGVLPGDDFFAYANGDWLKSTVIPADRSSWGGFEVLIEDTTGRLVKLIEGLAAKTPSAEEKKVADFYAALMDEAGVEAKGLAPLRPLLDKIGAIKDKAALTAVLGATLRADVDPLNNTNFFTENLFGVWIAQGLSDPAHYTPYLLQGGLGMPDRAYYLNDTPDMQALRVKYQAHIAATFKLAGISEPEARAARVFELERNIAGTHASREDSADVLKANNQWSAADFARKAPGMDWKAFFASAGLGEQKKFIIWHPSAIIGAAKLVQAAPLEAWKDFLAFHSINRVSDALPKAFVEQHFDFYGRALSGTPQSPARWKRSLNAVNNGMPDAVGQMYVAKYFPPESKQRVQQMVGNIVDAFHARIDKLDWMAAVTKKEAHAKLKSFYVGIGYPDKWTSYEQLAVSPDDALGNQLRAQQLRYRQQLAKLRQPVDRAEWCMAPQDVNAVNMPLQNAINFPAAILQPPFFDADRSDAMNYGSIGAVIGHEISHSFDDQGAQFDSKGRLRDWWTATDGKHFKQMAAALAKQYSAYRPFPDLAINGQLTLSENLADLAGLAASYDAYQASLANKRMMAGADQQFFVGFATTWRSTVREAAMRQRILTNGHAPSQWRSYTVRNLDAWYRAFDVQPDQQLYLAPKDRVNVW
jgi:endothelin-converting enzyme/putative endopeptidase